MAEVTQRVCDGCRQGESKAKGPVSHQVSMAFMVLDADDYEWKDFDIHNAPVCARKVIRSHGIQYIETAMGISQPATADPS